MKKGNKRLPLFRVCIFVLRRKAGVWIRGGRAINFQRLIEEVDSSQSYQYSPIDSTAASFFLVWLNLYLSLSIKIYNRRQIQQHRASFYFSLKYQALNWSVFSN